MIRVLHLANSLNTGGAEMQLLRLNIELKNKHSGTIDSRIVTLLPDGPLAFIAREAGVQVSSLGLSRGSVNPLAPVRLWRMIRDFRPHILQTWLYHSDLLGFVAGKLARVPTIAWYLQCSNMDLAQYSRLTWLTVKVNSFLSRWLDLLISQSQAASDHHLRLGYRPRHALLLPTGVDPDVFRPDPEAGPALRRELGLSMETPLLAVVARFDAMKGHDVFLRAAALVRRQIPRAEFLFCGDGMEPGNHPLDPLVRELGLGQAVHFLGRRTDTPRILAGIDALCVSSLFGEGMPNVILESMSCGTPCISTDVGDAARLLEGIVPAVPPGDPEALGRALTDFLLLPVERKRELGQAVRERVLREYSLKAMAERFVGLYSELAPVAT